MGPLGNDTSRRLCPERGHPHPVSDHPHLTLTIGAGFMLHLVDDLMTIGEFSDRSGLSAKRLRTYAAEGLLDPRRGWTRARGIATTRRASSLTPQVIDALRQAGVPLAEIRVFMRRPSREQLDLWARQLQIDANDRQGALTLARQLISADEDPLFPKSQVEIPRRDQ